IEVSTILAHWKGENSGLLSKDATLRRAVNFFDVTTSMPAAPILEQWMRDTAVRVTNEANGPASSGRPRAHIVMIDDLDRCDLAFTVQLLAAMTYWQTAPGFSIFFIVAADIDHLLDALTEHLPRGAQNPAQALEKYIHLAVNMPGFLENIDEVS